MKVPLDSPTFMFSQFLNFSQPGECAVTLPCDFNLCFPDYQQSWTSFHKHGDNMGFFFLLLCGAHLNLPKFPLGYHLSYF